jgi:hypothetical protein
MKIKKNRSKSKVRTKEKERKERGKIWREKAILCAEYLHQRWYTGNIVHRDVYLFLEQPPSWYLDVYTPLTNEMSSVYKSLPRSAVWKITINVDKLYLASETCLNVHLFR